MPSRRRRYLRCGDDYLRYGDDFKERVRLSGIDAPELFSAKCGSEKRLAQHATDRLTELKIRAVRVLLAARRRGRFDYAFLRCREGATPVDRRFLSSLKPQSG